MYVRFYSFIRTDIRVVCG